MKRLILFFLQPILQPISHQGYLFMTSKIGKMEYCAVKSTMILLLIDMF